MILPYFWWYKWSTVFIGEWSTEPKVWAVLFSNFSLWRFEMLLTCFELSTCWIKHVLYMGLLPKIWWSPIHLVWRFTLRMSAPFQFGCSWPGRIRIILCCSFLCELRPVLPSSCFSLRVIGASFGACLGAAHNCWISYCPVPMIAVIYLIPNQSCNF